MAEFFLFYSTTTGAITRGDGSNLLISDSQSVAFGTDSDTTFSHNNTDFLVAHTKGDYTIDNQVVTGSTIMLLGTDTSATDFQVQNNSASALLSVDGSGQADFSGNINASGGLDVDVDSVSISVGAGADWFVLHNGTDTVMTSATGDFVMDNTLVTGSTIVSLGTDTSATDFQVQGDGGTARLTVDGAGQVDIPGNADLTGGFDVDADSVTGTWGASADLTIQHNGTDSLITNTTGELKLENNAASSDIVVELGDAAGATMFAVNDSASTQVAYIDSDGAASFAAAVTATGGLVVDADSAGVTIGAGSDLTIDHNGTDSSIVNATGILKIENDAVANICIELGDAAGATALEIKDSGSATVVSFDSDGNVIIEGDLTVNGTTTTVDTQLQTADRYILSNSAYTADAAQTAGLVFNIDPDGTVITTDLSTITLTSTITFGTLDPSSIFAVGDIILYQNPSTAGNAGLYEIVAIVGGAGGTIEVDATPTEDFSNSALINDASATGTIVKVKVAVIRSDSAGTAFQVGFGDTVPLSYSDLATAAGATLQSAYNSGNTITLSDAEGDLIITTDEAGTVANFTITGSPGNYITTDATNDDLELGSSGVTVSILGAATASNSLTVSGASESLTISATGTHLISGGNLDVDVAADYSANLTNSAGELLISGGNLQLNDNIPLELGTSADDSIVHNGTNTVWTHTTGNLLFDNTLVTGSTVMRLGTNTAATSFLVQNDGLVPQFTIAGDGQGDMPGNLDVSGGLDVDADSVSISVGAGADFSILHNGTNTVATSTTGNFVLDNTNVTGTTLFDLGTDTSATKVAIRNNSGTEAFTVNGQLQTNVLCPDNTNNCFVVKEATNNYIVVDTTNGSEKVVLDTGFLQVQTKIVGANSSLLHLDDALSTAWTQTYVTLADSAASGWDPYKVSYGEVGLMEAIVAAGSTSASSVTAAAETISQYHVVAVDSAGAKKAVVSGQTVLANVLGFAAAAYVATDQVKVITSGSIDIPDAQWAAPPGASDEGKLVYADPATAGEVTLTPPSTSGHTSIIVGRVVQADGGGENIVLVGIEARPIYV